MENEISRKLPARPRPRSDSSSRPNFGSPAGKDVLQRAADHEADQLVALRAARIHGGNKRAVLEHRDPVGNLVQFVEAMRDIEDQHVLLAQAPDEREELRQVFLREHGRGLVHDQDPRLHRHGFGDLHDLALRRAEAGHTPPHIDPLKPDVLQDLLHAVVRGPPVDPPADAARRHAAEQDVLRDAEVRHQVGMLGHHANAELLAAQRAIDRLRLAAEADFTCVGLHCAGQDARERALARAVLADDGVHFAALGGEVDRAQRLRAAEALADARHV